MADSDLLNKLEAAAKSVVDELTFSEAHTVCTGQDDGEIALPNVICTASDTTEQIPPGSGNFVCRLHITKNTAAADSGLEAHKVDFAVLADAFLADNIGATLAAKVTNFYAYDPVRSTQMNGAIKDETKLSSSIDIELLCCAMDCV